MISTGWPRSAGRRPRTQRLKGSFTTRTYFPDLGPPRRRFNTLCKPRSWYAERVSTEFCSVLKIVIGNSISGHGLSPLATDNFFDGNLKLVEKLVDLTPGNDERWGDDNCLSDRSAYQSSFPMPRLQSVLLLADRVGMASCTLCHLLIPAPPSIRRHGLLRCVDVIGNLQVAPGNKGKRRRYCRVHLYSE